MRWLPAAGLLVTLFTSSGLVGQQVPDTAYEPRLWAPAHGPGLGPTVLVDAAHGNYHTIDGTFGPFADLLRRDGFVVRGSHSTISGEMLADIDVLVIANAMHEQSRGSFAPLPSLSAFREDEIAGLEVWVREGGALLLIADHMPIAGHNEALAAAFGVRFSNGFAYEPGREPTITFRRADGSLRASDLDGISGLQPVDSVTTFTGQAFRVDPGRDAQRVLVLRENTTVLLPEIAWQFSESTPRISGAHMLQGALIRHGRGRLAVFGEAAAFTAQLAGANSLPMGMNSPAAAENYRFVLAVMRWLTGSPSDDPRPSSSPIRD